MIAQQSDDTLPNSGQSENVRASSESQESAQQPDETGNYSQLRRLLRQLEDSELSQRDAAETEIIQLGTEVLKFLPSVTPQTSGEMKVRLQRIRQALERQVSEGFLEASHVTLEGRFSLSQLLDNIRQQTNNEFFLQNAEQGAGDLTVEVEWENVAFWDAIQNVLDQTDLRIIGFATTENQIALGPGYGQQRVAPFSTGPFRVDVASIESQQNFGSQIEGQVKINLLLTWESRLQPVFMQLPMSVYRAQLKDGMEIGAVNPQSAPEVRLNVGGCSAQVEIQMERPERGLMELESLKGQFVVSVPGDRHQFTFEKFSGGGRQLQKHGDLSVTLEGSRRNGPVYEIRLFVQFGDSAGALDSFRGWVMSNRAYLQDSQGTQLENVGYQTYASTGNGVGISYLFQINQDPSSLVLIYESPSAITRQTVDFEIRNIPLP